MAGATGTRRRVVVVAAALTMLTGAMTVSVDAGAGRYLDPVFADATETPDILYRSTTDYNGDPIDLHLDLWEPVGDTAQERPLLIWMHGGGFTGGSKSQGRATEMAREFARRGFVVASIDYRVNPTAPGGLDSIFADPVFLQSVMNAYEDARAAVAFLRGRADQYRIDADAVFATGYSAGAVLSLMMASVPNPTVPGAETDPGRVQGAASVAGTMVDYAGIIIQPDEPPIYMAHGDNDPRVPYASGVAWCDDWNAGGNLCELFTMPGTGHDPSAFHEDIREQASHFFFGNVLEPMGYTTQVSPPTTVSTSTSTTTTVATTPTTTPPPTTPVAQPVPVTSDLAG